MNRQEALRRCLQRDCLGHAYIFRMLNGRSRVWKCSRCGEVFSEISKSLKPSANKEVLVTSSDIGATARLVANGELALSSVEPEARDAIEREVILILKEKNE